jgi:hypothetical protein
VWNADSGLPVRSAWDIGYSVPVLSTVWHPRDHMFAACALGPQQPVLVWTWDPEVDAASRPAIAAAAGDQVRV